MIRRNWQRNELLLALNLYCRLPFGQYHSRNPQIIQLAQFIERTPDAVAMKLGNFASFDSYHKSRKVKGLQNASQADKEVWNEFNANWEALAVESELIYKGIDGSSETNSETLVEEAFMPFTGATEAQRLVKVRLGQSFFRKVILNSYRRCCVCGIPIKELLIASHIIPWRDDENLRVNPHNGLCLCALHDKGFDKGLFTLGESYELIIGKSLRDELSNPLIQNAFLAYEKQPINLPDKFIPDQAFLEIHRQNHFLG